LGTMQTIAGEDKPHFVDTTEGQQAKVIVRDPFVDGMNTKATMTSDVDDVDRMNSLGVDQRGGYGQVNTVGMVSSQPIVESNAVGGGVGSSAHPYYNPNSSTNTTMSKGDIYQNDSTGKSLPTTSDFVTNDNTAAATTTSTANSTTVPRSVV